MYQENVVLCGASAYEQKYYFNKMEITLQDELDNVLVLHASSGVQAAKSSVARQKEPESVQPILAEFSHWNLMITETCSLKQRLRKLMDFMMILAVH